jgi:hypothetical protein
MTIYLLMVDDRPEGIFRTYEDAARTGARSRALRYWVKDYVIKESENA